MSRHIRIPLLVDVLLVDDAEEMKALNADPGIGRVLVEGGGVVNRMLRRRILEQMRAGTELLPVFVGQEDEARRARQLHLTDALEKRDPSSLLSPPALDSLGRYVAGQEKGDRVGPLVQQALGRIFLPTYLATKESYRAAKVLDRWPRSGPLRALWYRRSGKVTRARELLTRLAHGDAECLHATSIALHNVVKSLEAMRELAAHGDGAEEQQVVERCLVAPSTALRSCSAPTRVADRRLRHGSLVVFRLEKMRQAGAGDLAVFHRGEWSQCPALTFVPRLLTAVWRSSQAGGS